MESRKMNKLFFLWYLCGYRIEESREWRRVPTSTRISKSVPARIVPVGRLGVCMESLGQKCGAMIESHHAFQWWSLCEPGPERNVSQTLVLLYTQALLDSPQCPACGHPKETLEHYLLQCPSYDHERWPILNLSGGRLPQLTKLLSSPKMLVPLANYMEATERFETEMRQGSSE